MWDKLFDSGLRRKIRIPVQRYLCKRKNNPDPGSHRTFSLLPRSCIPFIRYDIPSMLSAQKDSQGKNRNKEEGWYSFCADYDTNIGYETYLGFFNLFETGLIKLSLHIKRTISETREYLFQGNSVSISYGFYKSTGKFLFGTPSQDRF